MGETDILPFVFIQQSIESIPRLMLMLPYSEDKALVLFNLVKSYLVLLRLYLNNV